MAWGGNDARAGCMAGMMLGAGWHGRNTTEAGCMARMMLGGDGMGWDAWQERYQRQDAWLE